MKTIYSIALSFFLVSVAYAQTCPPANDIFIKQIDKVRVVAPAGWHVTLDQRKTNIPLVFSVAAWGDHKHSNFFVRCHYYNNSQDHVALESDNVLPESAFVGHLNWTRIGDDYYYLCSNVGTNVNSCSFG